MILLPCRWGYLYVGSIYVHICLGGQECVCAWDHAYRSDGYSGLRALFKEGMWGEGVFFCIQIQNSYKTVPRACIKLTAAFAVALISWEKGWRAAPFLSTLDISRGYLSNVHTVSRFGGCYKHSRCGHLLLLQVTDTTMLPLAWRNCLD